MTDSCQAEKHDRLFRTVRGIFIWGNNPKVSQWDGSQTPQKLKQFTDNAHRFLLQKRSKFENSAQFTS